MIRVLLLVSALCLTNVARAADQIPAAPTTAEKVAPQEIRIEVKGGYQPNLPTATTGRPIRLTFVKKDYSGCTKEIVFPTLGIRRTLPVDQPVVIDLPAQPAGEIPFQCGMNMVRGKLIVRAE